MLREPISGLRDFSKGIRASQQHKEKQKCKDALDNMNSHMIRMREKPAIAQNFAPVAVQYSSLPKNYSTDLSHIPSV